MFKLKAFTVSEINRYIKRILGSDPIINNAIVEGEISNVTLHSSGHAYFTLKDSESKLSCVMFKTQLMQVNNHLKNGDKVQAKGQISVFERDGKYQLYVTDVKLIGIGELHLRYQALKKELEGLGYFDPKHKKTLPKLPKTIALITSPTGAAIQDILSVAKRRSTYSELLIVPVQVQGEKAITDIIQAIECMNRRTDVDLILLARGGGSIEELWAFNERGVVDAIFSSKLPIITGIGHETDFTLSDFVSDLRAPTPSAAAEIAIQSKDEIAMMLNQTLQRMFVTLQRKNQLDALKLQNVSQEVLMKKALKAVANEKDQIDRHALMMQKMMQATYSDARETLLSAGDLLEAMNPLKVLRRGYGLVMKDSQIINSIHAIAAGDRVCIQLSDGRLETQVNTVVSEGEADNG